MSLSRFFSVALLMLATIIPTAVNAFPFGGRITLFHVCYNETIFARLSAPVPGDYIWTTGTRTYQFGPPRASGQWLLGLTGIPADCLWSFDPIFPVPAIAIMMMGSSQATFTGRSSGSYSTDPTTLPRPLPGGTGSGGGSGGGTGGGNGGGGAGASLPSVLITEVYAGVDATHGTDPRHEWVELHNTTNANIDISGWTIATASGSDTIPSGTIIGAGTLVLVTQTSELRNHWTIPTDVDMAVLGSPIGNGLSLTGDTVTLRNSSGAAIDAVSWGASTVAFSPSAPVVSLGHSLIRNSIFTDTNTATDWSDRTTPSPGN